MRARGGSAACLGILDMLGFKPLPVTALAFSLTIAASAGHASKSSNTSKIISATWPQEMLPNLAAMMMVAL